MAGNKDTLWEKFLSPVVRLFIDEEGLREFSEQVNWEEVKESFSRPEVVYPRYYLSENFHGVEGGYLNSGAAVSYDPITQYVLPPSEKWVRQAAIDSVQGIPSRILDLGCGTGSTTLMLKKAFPQAEVIGLDLSPYMLFMADHKAQQEELEIDWVHGNAEATGFPDGHFDLVSASLLFHETPSGISQAILHEAFRLLRDGGEVLILDGNQQTLRHTEWLTEIFEEPYIKEYAQGSVDAWIGAAGFKAVKSEDFWFIHQISRGIKPTASYQPETVSTTEANLTPALA